MKVQSERITVPTIAAQRGVPATTLAQASGQKWGIRRPAGNLQLKKKLTMNVEIEKKLTISGFFFNFNTIEKLLKRVI